MSFRLVDHPADRPEFLREAIDIFARNLDAGRARLLSRIESASDEELARGTEEDWGVGMVAYHLLVSERGMVGIALRLARGETPPSSAQPRPEPGSVTRAVLTEAAAKAAKAVARLRAEFSSAPDYTATAPSPYFGPFNCVSWLLAASFHYQAHLEALDRGGRSAF
jgi:DinB family protein